MISSEAALFAEVRMFPVPLIVHASLPVTSNPDVAPPMLMLLAPSASVCAVPPDDASFSVLKVSAAVLVSPAVPE